MCGEDLRRVPNSPPPLTVERDAVGSRVVSQHREVLLVLHIFLLWWVPRHVGGEDLGRVLDIVLVERHLQDHTDPPEQQADHSKLGSARFHIILPHLHLGREFQLWIPCVG